MKSTSGASADVNKGLCLTHDGGEAACGILSSDQLIQVWVVKLQTLQKRHITTFPFSVKDVEQTACG